MPDFSPLGLSPSSAVPIETDESDDIVLATIKRTSAGAASAWGDDVVTSIAIGGGTSLTDITFAANNSSTLSFNDSTHTDFLGDASSIVEALNSGIHRLAVVPGIDLSATGTTNLYTVPAGQSVIVTDAVIRVSALTSGSTVSSDVELGIGVDSSQGDIIASQELTNLREINQAFRIGTETSLLRIATSTEVIALGIDVAAVVTSGSTFTATVDLFGYII